MVQTDLNLCCTNMPTFTFCWIPVLNYVVFHLLQGLVVPVIRNVGNMNFKDIELAVNALGEKVSCFNSLPASGKFYHLLITFANSFDPDQD